MLLDEKIMDFERFFITKTSQNCSRVKSTGVCLIYIISDQEKNTKVFNSKFCLQGEHEVCCKLVTFFRPVFPWVFIDLYRVSYSGCNNADFEKSDGFSRQIMLALQTKFRVENFCIFSWSEMI